MFSLFFMLYIVYSHTFTNKRNLASPFETFTTIIQKVVRKSKWVEIKILETSSRSRKTAMSKPLLIKLQASVLPLYWKRHSDAGVSVFFVNFAKFLRTAFFKRTTKVAASLCLKFVKSFHFVLELKICVSSYFYNVYCLLGH